MTRQSTRLNRLIFVCQVFYPDSSSTSQLFTPLFRHMSDQGTDIEVLCGFSGQTDSDHSADASQLGNIRIRRCGLPIKYRKNLLYRAVSYLAFLLHLTGRLLFVGKNDLVFGVTNPPFVAGVLWLTSRVRRFRYQYMILDAYPEGLIALGNLKEHGFVSRLWFAMNRLAYRAAESIVVLGRDMTPVLQENYDIGKEKIAYIPHWSAVETPAPRPKAQSALLQRLDLENKFIVQYSGNMGIWHDMETFVRAADELRGVAGIHFLFIGNGVKRKGAESLSRELALENVTWHDFVPIEELEDSLSSCDCALVSQKHGLEGVAVPCKLYGILASGRAIIAQVPNQCEVALVVNEESCGLVVEPGDVSGLVAAIRRLYESTQQTSAMGERAFDAFRSKYRLEQALRAFGDHWQITPAGDSMAHADVRQA